MRTSLGNHAFFRHALFLAVGAATCIADQATKAVVTSWAQKGVLPIRILPATHLTQNPLFSIIWYKNTGIAFSIPLPETIILPLIAIFLLCGGLFLRKEIDLTRPVVLTALGLILGGALGNLLDRIRFGYVVDFISVWIFPVWNLADAAITIGILMLIVKAHARIPSHPHVDR